MDNVPMATVFSMRTFEILRHAMQIAQNYDSELRLPRMLSVLQAAYPGEDGEINLALHTWGGRMRDTEAYSIRG